ncbi:hypothetical protein F511_16935 [Dorcoceras hygrometricum]|uniref:Uncharacterized protein n=1 Tax=Dorcoceras hygrometricum TaxID=472368 RepID=A0A2Z7C5J1_9LAMI|nr:hypothetical protein F511_16935 [Dorcoceras hygrometricum]
MQGDDYVAFPQLKPPPPMAAPPPTPKPPDDQGGNTANRFGALDEEIGFVSGDDQEVENVNVAGNGQRKYTEDGPGKEKEDGSGKDKGIGSHHEALLTPSYQHRLERSNANRFDTQFVDTKYVTDDEQDVDINGREDLRPWVTEPVHKETINSPFIQHDPSMDGDMVPPVTLQPICLLNKAQSSLGSRQSQSNECPGYMPTGNLQLDIEMAPNIVTKTIDEPLSDAVDEEIPEDVNLEDEEMENAPTGPLQRSLSAGNLKLKGPVITHRVVTRSHTRSQGNSSSKSFQ